MHEFWWVVIIVTKKKEEKELVVLITNINIVILASLILNIARLLNCPEDHKGQKVSTIVSKCQDSPTINISETRVLDSSHEIFDSF